jgi:hypothetical protein
MGEWRYSSTILKHGTRCRLVSFMTQQLYPQGAAPGTHCIWSWEGPRAGLDPVEERNISCPASFSARKINTFIIIPYLHIRTTGMTDVNTKIALTLKQCLIL